MQVRTISMQLRITRMLTQTRIIRIQKWLRYSIDRLSSDKLSIKDYIINQGMIFNNMEIIHTSLAFSNHENAKQRSCAQLGTSGTYSATVLRNRSNE